MKSIEVLEMEHDNILLLTDIMEQACINLIEKKEINTNDFKDFIYIARNYGDRLHHQKEEKILFKVMTDTLGKIAENLVTNGMLVEHDLGRLYVMQLEDAISNYEKGDTSYKNIVHIIGNSYSYIDLLRRHISKENNAAYVFAKNHLSKEDILYVEEESLKHDLNNKTIKEKEDLISKLNYLKEKYK